jgi:hypothetical protein
VTEDDATRKKKFMDSLTADPLELYTDLRDWASIMPDSQLPRKTMSRVVSRCRKVDVELVGPLREVSGASSKIRKKKKKPHRLLPPGDGEAGEHFPVPGRKRRKKKKKKRRRRREELREQHDGFVWENPQAGWEMDGSEEEEEVELVPASPAKPPLALDHQSAARLRSPPLAIPRAAREARMREMEEVKRRGAEENARKARRLLKVLERRF